METHSDAGEGVMQRQAHGQQMVYVIRSHTGMADSQR